jgi:hypothetical protein
MKAQVSVEFIIIFTIVLLVFTTFGYFFLDNYEKSSATKGLAQSYADEIKARFVSVSLSPVNVEVKLDIVDNINGIPIEVSIFKFKDNLITIRKKASTQQLAAANLPYIDSTTSTDPIDPTKKLIITKINNKITVKNP